MKTAVFILFLLATISSLVNLLWYKPEFSPDTRAAKILKKHDLNTEALSRLKKKAGSFRMYNDEANFDTGYCFLVDMKIPSGKKRFFVYNLEKDSVETAGLVTHGSGSDKGAAELYFSNVPNSNCTSLGKYKIGGSYTGKFGLAFKLHGLERTNDKAFERFVVLHAHGCVPGEETYPAPICESWGCPTVSPTFLTTLKKYIDKAGKPILLWIYY